MPNAELNHVSRGIFLEDHSTEERAVLHVKLCVRQKEASIVSTARTWFPKSTQCSTGCAVSQNRRAGGSWKRLTPAKQIRKSVQQIIGMADPTLGPVMAYRALKNTSEPVELPLCLVILCVDRSTGLC